MINASGQIATFRFVVIGESWRPGDPPRYQVWDRRLDVMLPAAYRDEAAAVNAAEEMEREQADPAAVDV